MGKREVKCQIPQRTNRRSNSMKTLSSLRGKCSRARAGAFNGIKKTIFPKSAGTKAPALQCLRSG
ncbi:hypothetical protein GCM10009569_09820 [Arthrobacter russicus]